MATERDIDRKAAQRDRKRRKPMPMHGASVKRLLVALQAKQRKP